MTTGMIGGILRVVIPVILTWLAAKGILLGVDASVITEAAIVLVTTLAAGTWSVKTNSPTGIIEAAASLPQTSVSETGKTITIVDPGLQAKAAAAATPVTPPKGG